MPKYHRKPWSENRGKRMLICGLTGKTWKAWKHWCYREGYDLYAPETLKNWLLLNPLNRQDSLCPPAGRFEEDEDQKDKDEENI